MDINGYYKIFIPVLFGYLHKGTPAAVRKEEAVMAFGAGVAGGGNIYLILRVTIEIYLNGYS